MEITREDWNAYRRTRDPRLRDLLITANIVLVRKIAGRLSLQLPSCVELGDLESAGAVGLLSAVESYDPEQLAEFATYAQYRIRGAMLDDLRRQDFMPRWFRAQAQKITCARASLQSRLRREPTDEELACAFGMSLAAYCRRASQIVPPVFLSLDELSEGVPEKPTEDLRDDECWTTEPADRACRDPFSEAVVCEHARVLRAMIGTLPPQERLVLTLYYVQGVSIKPISVRMGVSEGRVSQIHTSGLTRMLERLQRRRLTRDDLIGDERAAWAPSRRVHRGS